MCAVVMQKNDEQDLNSLIIQLLVLLSKGSNDQKIGKRYDSQKYKHIKKST